MSEKLHPGSYYLFSPKQGALPSFLSFGRDKAGQERATALLRGADKGAAAAPPPLSTFNPSPATYQLAGGAVAVVQPGLFDVAGELLRVQPHVAGDAKSVFCVFSGYLSNLDELAERYAQADPGSPSARGSPTAVLPAPPADPRQLAAELVARAYRANRGGDLLVLLSELQGCYAFCVYDSEKHCAFAARDSSGREPLLYEIEEDGALSLANTPLEVATAEGGGVRWAELPPGHYISGRTPKLGQFALTPEQVSIREFYESLQDEFEGGSPRGLPYGEGALPPAAVGGGAKRSTSSELEAFHPDHFH